jgi:xylulokinase
MKYILGIDIGTQGTKTALFDENGRCAAEALEKSEIRRPGPGAVEEEPEKQVTSVCNTIRECIEKSGIGPGDIAGISIDGQMAGIIGIGRDGRNVTPYDSWLDTRCGEYIKKMDREAGDEIIRSTGGPPSYNHGPKILWWKHERPEIYAKIHSFVQPGGYAAMRLCGLSGNEAFIDSSYLHFSGFADNTAGSWNGSLADRFGVDMNKLPRIVSSHEQIGTVTTEMADRAGLKAGTPVIAGCGDTAASFLAAGAVSDGVCVDVAGTASVFATTTSRIIPDTKTRTLGCGKSAVPGHWHPYAYINGGGMNLEWFRKEIILRGRDDGEVSFDELNTLLDKMKPSMADPVFIPHLGGRVCPSQPDLRGAWTGLAWDHTAAHLYRAMFEGIALEYGLYFSILRNLDPSGFQPKEIRITGGGGKSRVWNQLKADVLQIPVVLLNHDEGAPLGSALVAGYGAGLFSDVAQKANEWVTKTDTIDPDPEKQELYTKRIEKYTELIEALNTIEEKYGTST